MTNGARGELCEEYVLFRAAQYCNCSPWELEEKPSWYRNHAIAFESAELWAEGEKARIQEREMKRRKR